MKGKFFILNSKAFLKNIVIIQVGIFFTQRTQSISQRSQRMFLTLRALRPYPLRTLRGIYLSNHFESPE